ncbi:hypothetical protein BDD12DRAFT_847113 [Trichophaea hybrida]|nr:hypothetical protein BDD12DRAFT_847113 [Trichophaea hybrida]
MCTLEKPLHNHCPSLLPLLPPELLLIIADYLPTSCLRSIAFTSRQLYATLQNTLHRRILTDKSLRFTLPRCPASSALQWASFNGYSDLVEEMLATGTWMVDETTGGCRHTALCLASETGDEKTIKLLLRYGAAVYGALHGAKNIAVLGWVGEEALRRTKGSRRRVMNRG